MEPVTHFLTGACLSRSGLNRTTAYCTLVMTLAAEAADLDVFWSLEGPAAGLQHHRGWTHTLIGTPVVALATVALVYAFHRWRSRRRPRPNTAQPIHWPILLLCAWIAALSHILLDFTNNYGVRPFFPFNPHWYAAGLVFIFEPVIFLALLAALILPALFSLIDREVTSRSSRPPFQGRALAISALAVIVALWGWRAFEQSRARQLFLDDQATSDSTSAPVLRSQLSPYPVTPFRWQAVLETPAYYRVATIDLATNSVTSDSATGIFYKPADSPALLAAKRSPIGRAYLDWSQFPYLEDLGPALTRSGQPATLIRFTDLRFRYDSAFLGGRTRSAMAAAAYVAPDGRVLQQQFEPH